MQRQKGVLSDVEALYSPEWIRKKYARVIMLQVPQISGLGKASVILEMCCRNWSRIGFTQLGGRVLIVVVEVLEPEANIYLTPRCEAGVSGPHCRDCLSNQPYEILHHMGANLVASLRNFPSVLLSVEDTNVGEMVLIRDE